MAPTIARALVAQALYDHDGGASGPGLIATKHAEAHGRAEAALNTLAAHGWVVLPVSTVSDMQDERDKLMVELAEVTAQRDRLIAEHTVRIVTGHTGVEEWPRV